MEIEILDDDKREFVSACHSAGLETVEVGENPPFLTMSVYKEDGLTITLNEAYELGIGYEAARRDLNEK